MKKKVLVVDDEIIYLNVLEEQLKKWYDVVRAYDGIEGLEIALRDRPNVIVCDVTMPNMDGIEFCRQLRKHPEMDDIPFIFLTAKERSDFKVQGLRTGADDYVVKPIEFEELRARIELHLNRVERIRNELNQFKDDIIANLSHELRTPLTIIKGYIQLLLKDLGDDDQSLNAYKIINTYISEIENSSNQLGAVIENLLFLAEVQSTDLFLVKSDVFIGDVISNIFSQYQEQLESNQIELDFEFSDEIGFIQADPIRLLQAIKNIFDNSVKFTPSNGLIRVLVTEEGDGLLIAIQNSGEEIPESIMPYIYDKFFQGDTSTTRKYGGTGCGLYVTKIIVEAHHGTITTKNMDEGGCEFRIWLPK